MNANELECYQWLCNMIHKTRCRQGKVEAESGHYCAETQALEEDIRIMETLCELTLCSARYTEMERRMKQAEIDRDVALTALEGYREAIKKMQVALKKERAAKARERTEGTCDEE